MKRPRFLLTYATLVLVSILWLTPVFWLLITSLKSDRDIYRSRDILPSAITLDQYRAVLFDTHLPRTFVNSALVTSSTVAAVLAIACLGGYAVSRFDFRGKSLLMLFIIASRMVPTASLFIPIYLFASKLGLIDTRSVLVLIYSAWMVPMILWVMRAFFNGLPHDLDNAARMDGYSRFAAFRKVILPLSRPGLAAAAILTFIFAWNELMFAQILIRSNENFTVPVQIYLFLRPIMGIDWGSLTAAAVLAILPIIVFYLALQQHFIRGLTEGAIKG